MILAIHSVAGVGCSSSGGSDVLADSQVVVRPVEGPGLLDFLMRLLDQIEAVCLHLPAARGTLAVMLREVAGEFSGKTNCGFGTGPG